MIVAVLPGGTVEDVRRDLSALAALKMPEGSLAAEIRLDMMSSPTPDVAKNAPIPVIATCRRPRDGGRYRGDEAARLDLLAQCAHAGASWVDVESDALDTFAVRGTKSVVASFHDFDGCPTDLASIAKSLLLPGVVMVKIAVRVKTLTDLIALGHANRVAPGQVSAFGLGSAGLASRILFDRLGAAWVYGRFGPDSLPSETRELSAAGLPDFLDLTKLYRGSMQAGFEVGFAVLGEHAFDSIGPFVFNRIFRDVRAQASYVPLTTPSIAGLREAAHLLGLRGISVTTPFKENVIAFADRVHARALAIGAANTLLLDSGQWVAYNTDYDGFRVPVTRWLHLHGMNPTGKEALVVGVGGAGRAAALALRTLGFHVSLHGRNKEKTLAAAKQLSVDVVQEPKKEEYDAVVHATPAGAVRDTRSRAVDPTWATEGGFIFETNYRPLRTRLVVDAEACGRSVITGDEMYIAQATAQLQLFWAGVPDPETAVRRSVRWAMDRIASS